jgi:hypothetical protein
MIDARTRDLLTVGAATVAGLAGSAVAFAGRGGDAQFLQAQRHPPDLRQADVERVVRSAPDPRTGAGQGVAASCSSQARGPLRNPWSCVVRFRSGKRVRVIVRVREDGTYSGRYAAGGGVTGCCIDLPGTR